jgi:NAD(P)-dependent dehydrogenase (short-subunit alcohol dehydrogenase family)
MSAWSVTPEQGSATWGAESATGELGNEPRQRRIVVVGGTSGIGRAAVRRFAEAGHDVTAVGRDAGKLATLSADLPEVNAVPADATKPEQLAAMFASVGPFTDLVVLVSGRAGAGRFATLDLQVLAGAVTAKTIAQLAVAQAALPYLAADGSITFVTAASAQSALPETAGLAAVNGALEAAVAPLAVELAPRRVNAVSPGVVATDWWDSFGDQRDEVLRGFADQLPVRRIGSEDDIVRALELMITGGFITGTVLAVDGGGHL